MRAPLIAIQTRNSRAESRGPGDGGADDQREDDATLFDEGFAEQQSADPAEDESTEEAHGLGEFAAEYQKQDPDKQTDGRHDDADGAEFLEYFLKLLLTHESDPGEPGPAWGWPILMRLAGACESDTIISP